ncbi:hypothetical protein [Actinomycetospora flava]|uniref:hypothetical protein n=1 Tax=Actinomycetospora flava TaxID=3129232 RepID=UPI0035A01091
MPSKPVLNAILGKLEVEDAEKRWWLNQLDEIKKGLGSPDRDGTNTEEPAVDNQAQVGRSKTKRILAGSWAGRGFNLEIGYHAGRHSLELSTEAGESSILEVSESTLDGQLENFANLVTGNTDATRSLEKERQSSSLTIQSTRRRTHQYILEIFKSEARNPGDVFSIRVISPSGSPALRSLDSTLREAGYDKTITVRRPRKMGEVARSLFVDLKVVFANLPRGLYDGSGIVDENYELTYAEERYLLRHFEALRSV